MFAKKKNKNLKILTNSEAKDWQKTKKDPLKKNKIKQKLLTKEEPKKKNI